MATHLTILNPVLEHLVQQTPPGMMFWSGTCTDPTRTCGNCQHYCEVLPKRYGCGLYQVHTGVAQPLRKVTPACKYYEAK
jgi:hypothetical protein